jgi:hypothetical protein
MFLGGTLPTFALGYALHTGDDRRFHLAITLGDQSEDQRPCARSVRYGRSLSRNWANKESEAPKLKNQKRWDLH